DGVGRGGDLAIVPGPAGVYGPAGALAAERGHPGLGGADGAGSRSPGPRPVAMAGAAGGLGRALPGDPSGGGAATEPRRPLRGRRGGGVPPAGLPARERPDRPGGSAARDPGVEPAAGPGFRAGGLGNVRPAALRAVGVAGLVGDRSLR